MKTAEMKQKRTDNKGFSLVELIIVMAIMAIMVGIVGTQAIPYLNRARETKDRELLSAYCTAAVTAYTMNAEEFTTSTGTVKIADVFTTETDSPQKEWQASIKNLVTYADLDALKDASSSSEMQKVTGIAIELNLTNNTITATATGADQTKIAPVVSQL